MDFGSNTKAAGLADEFGRERGFTDGLGQETQQRQLPAVDLRQAIGDHMHLELLGPVGKKYVKPGLRAAT